MWPDIIEYKDTEDDAVPPERQNGELALRQYLLCAFSNRFHNASSTDPKPTAISRLFFENIKELVVFNQLTKHALEIERIQLWRPGLCPTIIAFSSCVTQKRWSYVLVHDTSSWITFDLAKTHSCSLKED